MEGFIVPSLPAARGGIPGKQYDRVSGKEFVSGSRGGNRQNNFSEIQIGKKAKKIIKSLKEKRPEQVF